MDYCIGLLLLPFQKPLITLRYEVRYLAAFTLAMVTRYEYFTRYIILLPYSLRIVTNYSFPKSNLSYINITASQKVARYIT